MNPTMLQISIGIIMLVVGIGIVILFKRYLAGASTRRMTDMMKRLALDPKIGTRGDAQTEAIIKEVRQRCRKCASEDVCERWLAGDVKGRNTFCPNAPIFDMLAKTDSHASDP